MITYTTNTANYNYNWTVPSTTTSNSYDCFGYRYVKPSAIESWNMLVKSFDKRKEITEDEIIDLIKGDE